MAAREPLSRERIVAAAIAVADGGGLGAVSMRNVARELGVEAMSLYHHIAGKEALLDALAEEIFAQFPLPEPDAAWRESLAHRCHGARAILAAHPWALGLQESRANPGPANLRQHDHVLGVLRLGGFDLALAAHAYSVLDAYVYGFVLTEVNLPFGTETGTDADAFAAALDLPVEEYPHLAEMLQALVVGRDYDYGDEFGYGLELILDQLERRLAQGGGKAVRTAE